VADQVPVLEGEILLRDIDDEIQQDNLAEAWQRYGVWVIALAIAILVGVGGWQGWLAWRDHQRLADAVAYEAALSKAAAAAVDNKESDSVAAFASITAAKGNSYATVAHLALAATELRQGNAKDALTAYQTLYNDPATDGVYRDLARLLYAIHGLDAGIDPHALESVLAPLADPANAFHASALEVRGLIALKGGDTAAAHAIFAGLASDKSAPQSLRSRAETLAAATAPVGAP